MNRTKTVSITAALATTALLSGFASPAMAAEEAVTLNTCAQSLGSIAVVEGDTQGWSDYGLGSPRELINALATESGCFTPHSPAAGTPADFLMNVVAGDSEEVDKSVEMAKSAAVEGLVRSGAATGIISKVPIGGALFGAFGGLGGKKKKVAAGIKLLSPATGQAIVTGTGEARKSTISFGGANASGYMGSKDGKMLVEAFIKAFNAVSAQEAAIAAVPRATPAPAAAAGTKVVADTVMRASPAADAATLRTLRAGTSLAPTGKRDGLFIEVKDSYGTQGWVSVEDLG